MEIFDNSIAENNENLRNLDAYGGWLRFFKFLNLLWIILYPLLVIAALIIMVLAESKQEVFDSIAYLVEFFPPFIFSCLIYKRVAIKDLCTPNKIKSLINLELGLKIIVGLSLYILFNYGYISEKPTPILVDIIYFLIWASYFKRSKRVFSFYGANATIKL